MRSKERKILPCFPGRGNERVGQAKLPTQFSWISNCLLQLLLPGERQRGGWRTGNVRLVTGQHGFCVAFLAE